MRKRRRIIIRRKDGNSTRNFCLWWIIKKMPTRTIHSPIFHQLEALSVARDALRSSSWKARGEYLEKRIAQKVKEIKPFSFKPRHG